MNNIKVEIRGVDTSKLPKISNRELINLIEEYQISGDMEIKERIIECNLRLILSLVKKFNNRGENVDDIFQVGVVGLIKAIDNFDLSQGVQFSTYAVPMIIGEIKRFLRDNSAFRITRSIRDLAYKIFQLREEYLRVHNEEPTVDIICKELEESRENVVVALESGIAPTSLNEIIYNNNGECIYMIDKLKDNNNEVENVINEITVKQILDNLSDKEKFIIETRYFKNKTQMEIAKELGVSQAQVSRIEKAALKKIRNKNIG